MSRWLACSAIHASVPHMNGWFTKRHNRTASAHRDPATNSYSIGMKIVTLPGGGGEETDNTKHKHTKSDGRELIHNARVQSRVHGR